PWSESEFAALLGQPGVIALAEADGFILIRIAADEAEILTLAVQPAARRRGLGRRLVESGARAACPGRADRPFLEGAGAHPGARAACAGGADRLLLEVAEDNAAARALYAAAGFVEAGRRRAYYPRPEGLAADALILARALG